MHIHKRSIVLAGFSLVMGAGLLSCKKMVTVPLPVNSITSEEMFKTDAQAMTSMAGVYTQMVNGSLNFSNGYTTMLTGMSADELFYFGAADANMAGFAPNQLLETNSYTSAVWASSYKTIYNANSVIEGIAASESSSLSDSVRKQLTAEAKFIRAFCYFYLTNLFGDVPLVKTVDFNKTRYMSRTPVNEVYDQIIEDLTEAQELLSADYAISGAAKERILPTQWAATALLARVYLFKGEYANAAEQASAVIANTSLFSLEADPLNVFLIKSREAIWQMKQGTTDAGYKNSTPEGFNFLPNSTTGVVRYCLTPELLNTFETGDRRRTAWVSRTTTVASGYNYYPHKYKLGPSTFSNNPSTEYYMMLRLAEMYLIRAEAAANGAGGIAAAIADLNVIRNRANVPALPTTLAQAQVITAVARERQVELFAEWGHRWFDLKRTNKAHDVLSAMSSKQPWAGDYQLLYPIPPFEIQVNPRLVQNAEY
ncbi:RagB/SusD family nutrient uptake outer membrane protein [Niastella caeni]|uniref:RagB/SusD family nutrient uptake outer membrane protein n=1 Tax=Niastella caeni TaxID=2569763 RepID=A0A4S8HHS2_9BACT|nr:RagB/SusD family nutrient uptake outer membrane protein [Niastella caeni]THU34758.1 RagB/SusD family nutrient uptake outer membrane protein [Niastella caeni]